MHFLEVKIEFNDYYNNINFNKFKKLALTAFLYRLKMFRFTKYYLQELGNSVLVSEN